MPRLLALILTVAALCAGAADALAARRIALVIGNSTYTAVSPLPNPVNDAKLMQKSLEAAGFEVTFLTDTTQTAMKQAMLDFGRALKTDVEASVFYYAGHGIQVKGENYLVPVDADLKDENEVDIQAVAVNGFLNVMEGSASKVNIVILDACRNNPFPGTSRSASRGLASVIAPKGSYIAYSTAPGQVAADGQDDNSPYTKALAQAMALPGIKLEDTFKKAREIVLRETENAQVPWELTSITGDFYFVPKEAPASPCEGPQVASVDGAAATCLTEGTEFADCADCPQMVVLPAGSFNMGSPEDEKARRQEEGPRHGVAIARPFAAGKFEITRGDFAKFVKATGYKLGASCWVLVNNEIKDDPGRSFRDPGFAQDDQHPAICVSYADALAYIEWLSAKTSQRYRLLSEAEWEYAARAGTDGRFSAAADEAQLCGYANGGDTAAGLDQRLGKYFKKKKRPFNNCNDGAVFTQRVGSYSPNGFGLHDMTGNVWEWTADCYVDSHDEAPADGSARGGAADCERVTRGGSWFYPPDFLRVAFRTRADVNSRDVDVGFRLARDIE